MADNQDKQDKQDKQDNKHEVSATDVQRYLSGINFPASKQELIEMAEEQKANYAVIRVLHNLPDKQYDSPTDVTSAMGDRI